MPSFTLLDDSQASAAQPTSRLYTDLHSELTCSAAAGIDVLLAQLQAALQQGLFAVGVFPYELGVALQGLKNHFDQSVPSRILLYRQCRQLDGDQVSDWLQQQSSADQTAGLAQLYPSVDHSRFTQALDRIQQYIANGDTYQVNYTFRFHFHTYGEPCALYQRLRLRQSVPFGALIALPDGSAVLSLSPELFIRHRHGQLYARPMKGTAPAHTSGTQEENDRVNAQLAGRLSADMKNRAENVMIVDLLRNDLSRIAESGSVQVPDLFHVQRFDSVLQMTSGITATLKKNVTLSQIFKAMYPCGSITGAPKYRTMQIIQEVETEPRGIYTGAIGWFDPLTAQGAAQTVPDFCLSVPIRTLHLEAPEANGIRQGVMGVGAGIVFDSVAADEYQECLLKARFLTGLPAQFALFETMHATRENGCRYLARHLQRITRSAAYFGIEADPDEISAQLDLVCRNLPADLSHRLKLSIDGTGDIQIQTGLLSPLTAPVAVLLAPLVQSSASLWLRHKTTRRAVYDQAWREAEEQGAFDMLFFNERGELTEGGRSNVLVKLDGRWYTPPLSAGALPGVMRAELMSDPDWLLAERSITRSELLGAAQIAVCNALRGVLMATLIT